MEEFMPTVPYWRTEGKTTTPAAKKTTGNTGGQAQGAVDAALRRELGPLADAVRRNADRLEALGGTGARYLTPDGGVVAVHGAPATPNSPGFAAPVPYFEKEQPPATPAPATAPAVQQAVGLQFAICRGEMLT